MPATGGTPRELLKGMSYVWDPSGRRVYYVNSWLKASPQPAVPGTAKTRPANVRHFRRSSNWHDAQQGMQPTARSMLVALRLMPDVRRASGQPYSPCPGGRFREEYLDQVLAFDAR